MKLLLAFVTFPILVLGSFVDDGLLLLDRNKAKVPTQLVHAWEGRTSDFAVPPLPDTLFPRLRLVFGDDGTVTGYLGDASFVDCFVIKNRSSLGRLLKVKTDYIVRGRVSGIIGKKYSGENVISIPFGLHNDSLRGCVHVLNRGNYPDPVVPKFSIMRKE